MPPDPHPDPAYIALVERAELRYPYVSLRRLSALARAEPTNAGRGIGRWLRVAVARGIVLVDARQRVRRDGAIVSEQVYRLNRTHPSVVAALAGPSPPLSAPRGSV